MAKAKYQRRKHNRDLGALQRQCAALHAEIEQEKNHLKTATERADRARAARRRLETENSRTTETLAPLEALADHMEQAVASSWRDMRDATAELGRLDDRLSRASRTSTVVAAAAQSGFRLDNTALAHRGAPAGYQQIAFRTRLGANPALTRQLDMTGWVPPESGTSREQLRPYARATVHEHTPEALWTYAQPPWSRLPTGADAPQLRADLGTTSSGASELRHRRFPADPRRAMTIDKPWRHTPLVSEPSDAIDLCYWYHRSAWSQGWLTDTQPVPFWLPGEHATGFPRSKPLPNDTDLRLPFTAVAALFESSWNLPATKPPNDVTHTTLLFARGAATDTRPGTLEDYLLRLPVARRDLPTPLELIEHLGAAVEGLLLVADENNRPTNEFAWCLAIRHPWGLPLGRVVVPAHRDATRWAQAVDNVLGGVCLSHWHSPPAAPAAPGDGPLRPASTTDTDQTATPEVRVLDVGATSPGRSIPRGNGPNNRAASFRSGTWRWQWVGPGRRRQRPTWVRPTFVRGTKPARPQVYRLTPSTHPDSQE